MALSFWGHMSTLSQCYLFRGDIETQSCQNVNRIVNRFFIFSYSVSYRIVYRKIYKHLIKFIKNHKYTYI